MNRIVLAYATANTDLAHRIDNQLSRIGIPFEHLSTSSGNLPSAIRSAGEPVLLLVTDNLLKERNGMMGMLEVLQQFPKDMVILPVVADGVDANGQPVETHIDRMVNMLHYMNHWQSEWLNISALYQNAQAKEKADLEQELDAVRSIANQASDVLTMLRERAPVSLQELEANDFALFFQKFDLSDWHGQYRRLAAQNAEQQQVVEPAHLPETRLSSGILAPEPVEAPSLVVEPTIAPAIVPETPLEPVLPALYPSTEIQEEVVLTEKTQSSEDKIAQTIQDAQWWIERGQNERGVELLKIAVEEYPDDLRVASAYQNALGTQEPLPDVKEVAPKENAPAEQPPANDINSYELMGDLAFDKGDYLFAKYCWDRVAEVDANYPGIYRKLGLMTAEHLQDYRETALHYLQKALLANPKDKAVKSALADIQGESEQVQKHSIAELPTPVAIPPVASVVETKEIPKNTSAPGSSPGTVLITGATSGIGRATAEIFARNGYRLILTGRRIDKLVELKNHFEAAYKTESILLPFDVRDSGAVQAALDNLPASFQEIDILINNAGLAKGFSPIQEGNLDHWEQMIDTNVKGLLYVTRVISPGMVARRRGHIINICSSAGKEVYPNGNVYCATKFAVDALTKAMRLDLHAHNIRVSQVSPGHVEETEFAITRFDGDAERAKIYNDFQPLKSSDVAEVIYFMVTRPAHVNIQDVQLFGTQQASSTVINRSGR